MKVLLVEDSMVVARYVLSVLEEEDSITVLPQAKNGSEAVEYSKAYRPDVILMDLILPDFSGIEAIRRIMAELPVPIIVLSSAVDSSTGGEDELTYESFNAGAVKVLAKPKGVEQEDYRSFRTQLLRTIRIFSQVKVVRRNYSQNDNHVVSENKLSDAMSVDNNSCKLVVIGASTGGPSVLKSLLMKIEKPLNIPILISQHITQGFEQGLADWLSKTGHEVILANEELPVENKVYLSPADRHLVVRQNRISFEPKAPGNLLCPEIDRLFVSAAEYCGSGAAGIVLCGMGTDGTKGAGAILRAGGRIIAQEPETCIVSSMPDSVINLGSDVEVAHPDIIGNWLADLNKKEKAGTVG